MPNLRTAEGLLSAEEAAKVAFTDVKLAIQQKQNFKLEAAAGAGKTYTLIQTLNWLLRDRDTFLPLEHQRIACLTYTNVACEEIISRTDANPLIFVATLHKFLWEMVSPYQEALSHELSTIDYWKSAFQENPSAVTLPVEYDLGFRRIHEDRVSIHHDDVPIVATALFENRKFRKLITDKFPIILIDEYQDTPEGLIQSIISRTDSGNEPLVGLFGDAWQTIYDKRCGSIDHPSLKIIEKPSNFRSDHSIVDLLNRMRPELIQTPSDEADTGTVKIYHTNNWPGQRLTHHFKSQISHQAVRTCLDWIRSNEGSRTDNAKTLMLTHSVIAQEMGYPSLPKIYRDNDTFARKEDPVIAYLIDVLEPAIKAFQEQRFGDFFHLVSGARASLRAPSDKKRWSDLFEAIILARTTDTVSEVISLLLNQDLFAIPSAITHLQSKLERHNSSEAVDEEELASSRRLTEYRDLCEIQYSEIIALRNYMDEGSVFSTKHSVKGAEFDDVTVVVGRGWANYDFGKMLSWYNARHSLNAEDRVRFERWRNLFYVAVSRARRNLTLLIVQDLDETAMQTLEDWVGTENIASIEFSDDENVSEVKFEGSDSSF